MLFPSMFGTSGSGGSPLSELNPLLASVGRINLGFSVILMLAGPAVLILRIGTNLVDDTTLVLLQIVRT